MDLKDRRVLCSAEGSSLVGGVCKAAEGALVAQEESVARKSFHWCGSNSSMRE